MKKFLFFILFCLITTPCFAEFTITVSKTNLKEGEGFKVYLRQQDKKEDIDLTKFNDDFHIISQGTSQNITNINGNIKRVYETILTLVPKRTGKIEIPAIYTKTQHTKPVLITVSPATDSVQSENGETKTLFFVKSSINKKNPVVSEQLVYTVKLYLTLDSALIDGMIVPPQSEGAFVEAFGDATHYQEQYKGQAYNVYEHKFLVFPQRAGKVILSAPTFKGAISDPESFEQNNVDALFGYSNPFSQIFGQKEVVLKAQEITLDVAESKYIPAYKVDIEETISPQNADDTYYTGDAITRTITIQASGVHSGALPEINFAPLKEFKQYPGQSNTQELTDNRGIVGVKTKQIVFIPTNAGALTLPELKIDWLDIKTGKVKQAVLPAKSIRVLSKEPVEEKTDVPTTEPTKTTDITLPKSILEIEGPISAKKMLAYGAGVGFLIALFLFGLVLFIKKQYEKMKNREKIPNIKNACAFGNTKKIAEILLLKTKKQFPDKNIQTLTDIKGLYDSAEFDEQIDLLNEALYSSTQHLFDGKDFYKIYKKIKPKKVKAEKKSLLPPLYPM